MQSQYSLSLWKKINLLKDFPKKIGVEYEIMSWVFILMTLFYFVYIIHKLVNYSDTGAVE